MRKQNLLAVVFGLLLCAAASAQTVYKSVDEHGNVTYSKEPPRDAQAVEPLKIPPGPSETERSSAERRASEMQQAADRVEQQRSAGEDARKAQIDAAEKRVELARQRLEKAKEVGPGDRTGNVGGGSRLNETYWERVRKAEEDLAEAQSALEKARSGR